MSWFFRNNVANVPLLKVRETLRQTNLENFLYEIDAPLEFHTII